jgi:hypothetical protein
LISSAACQSLSRFDEKGFNLSTAEHFGCFASGYGQTRSAVDGLIGVRRLILASCFPFFARTVDISPSSALYKTKQTTGATEINRIVALRGAVLIGTANSKREKHPPV